MIVRLLLVTITVLTVGACSSTSHCRKEQDYQKAGSIPVIAGVGDLKSPESPSALRIPPAPEKPVAFGEKYLDEDGDERWSCLDVPPRLEVPDEAEVVKEKP